MGEAESTMPGKKGWGCAPCLVIAVLVFVALGLVVPVFRVTREKANEDIASNHCRQIIIAFKDYSADRGGSYPVGTTANDAFREFLKAGIVEDERIFTAPFSPYHGDNQTGEAPDYQEALKAGENHWAMTKGLTDQDSGNAPLVFDNPAVSTWPPRWNAKEVDSGKPGQVRKGGKVVIGRNDGSITLEKVDSYGRLLGLTPPNGDSRNIFELAGPHEIMNVAK